VHSVAVTQPKTSGHLPAKVVRELERSEEADWSEGIPLASLLDRVNRLAEKLSPEDNGRQSRVSRVYSPRSFRHYQTLGCIDAPKRDGKQAVYGFRHFLQALVVRRLLGERMPSERIVALMVGRSTAETRQLLIEGAEVVARHDTEDARLEQLGAVENWRRIRIAPGIELGLRLDLPKPKPDTIKLWLSLIENALRKSLR